MTTYKKYIEGFTGVLSGLQFTDSTGKQVEIELAYSQFRTMLEGLKKSNGTVFLIGNGGSSGIVSHTSVDLLNSCKVKAFPITDNSQLTCFANDFGYEQVFSKPLETLISPNDILIAVSSSGKSKNILNAATIAREKNADVITFSGFRYDNPLRSLGTLNAWIESDSYGIVEIGHAFILHYLTDRFCGLIK